MYCHIGYLVVVAKKNILSSVGRFGVMLFVTSVDAKLDAICYISTGNSLLHYIVWFSDNSSDQYSFGTK